MSPDFPSTGTARPAGAPPRPTGVSLGTLLAAPELGLTLLVPGDTDPADIVITHCAVVELEEPGTYLSGYELLLITGLGLPQTESALDTYVSRLRASGISALGFGVEPVYREVPEPLIDACHRIGLPLVRVDRAVPFVQVTAHFAAELERLRVRGLQTVSTLARRLTAAVLRAQPERRVIEVLATETGSRVLLREGTDVLSAGGTDPDAPLFAQADALLDAGEGMVFGVTEDGRELVARRITEEGQRAVRDTVLVLVKDHVLSEDRTGFSLAADLIRVAKGLPRSQTIALDQLMMLLLVDGVPIDPAGVDRWARLVATALNAGSSRRVHTVVAVAKNGEPARPADLLWWRLALDTPFVDERAGSLRALVAEVPGTEVLRALERRGWIAGISAGYPVQEVATAVREAELLLPRAREAERSLVAGEELRSLGALIPADLSDRFAHAVLEPLLEAPDSAELIGTLYTWLLNNGGWDRAARALHLHRNAVRRQIQRVESLLGRDLEDAHARADLLFALRHHVDDGGAVARARRS
ncbi:PucR family transcriptional regulator [Mycetocola saprophilus]|uniref:PucR family transcriptional regulator n=1 Tax=Mycetocola saprophilus TaxID=76636 RepID=UPI0004BF0998|nr:PucR family transcriptional regulator [Mycetocola saprophilus]